VKEHTREPTQDSAVGFNAEKISEGCNAWGDNIKDLWLQSVIANIIHEELFEQDEVKDSKGKFTISYVCSSLIYSSFYPFPSNSYPNPSPKRASKFGHDHIYSGTFLNITATGLTNLPNQI
jgi:hypothetical protein